MIEVQVTLVVAGAERVPKSNLLFDLAAHLHGDRLLTLDEDGDRVAVEIAGALVGEIVKRPDA